MEAPLFTANSKLAPTAFSRKFFFFLIIYNVIFFYSRSFIYLLIYSFIHSFIYLFIYLWLRWVFVSALGLSLVAASGGPSSLRCAGLSLSQPHLLQSTGSRRAGSVTVAHGRSCSAACEIFPDQGSNPCPLQWQADSQPLRHQGSPVLFCFFFFFKDKTKPRRSNWKWKRDKEATTYTV